MVTQPLMYSLISKHPGSRKKYASFLEEKGVLSAGEADELVKNYRDSLDAGFHTNKNIISNFKPPFTVDWSKYIDIPWTQNAKTTLSKKEIEELGEKLVEICILVLEKAVKLTKTDMDDNLLEVVKKAIAAREEA